MQTQQKHENNIDKCRDTARKIKQKRAENLYAQVEKAEQKKLEMKQLKAKQKRTLKEYRSRMEACAKAKRDLISQNSQNAMEARRLKKYNERMLRKEK